jgi:nitrogen fixation/metabolism regulation signal transduction histidine kinase
MASERPRFAVELVVRIAVVAALATLTGWLLVMTHLRIVPLVLAIVGGALVAELLRFQRRANERLSAVLAAWNSGDLADRVRSEAGEPGFAAVEASLERIRERLQAAHRATEIRARYLSDVLDHAPVALLAVADGRISPLNAAARRLIGQPRDVELATLASFGATFVADLVETPIGSRRLTRVIDDEVHTLVLSVGAFTSDGRVRRLISLQDIQGELDGRTLDAWRDMAQVLAHEITGSLTPVASLSGTAAERLAEIDLAVLDASTRTLVEDAREACAVTARRSEGLLRFASRYRELAHLPPPQRERMDLGELILRVRELFAGELGGLALVVEPPPAPLRVSADRALLEQALINLVRNAFEALRGRPSPTVWLRGRVTASGRAALEVSDNGAGVPAELTERIFVPFFTTRKAGTGIGLSLVRLIVQAHGGTVAVSERSGGGATFTLTL